jgi:putative CocE/NonD family hydrolase
MTAPPVQIVRNLRIPIDRGETLAADLYCLDTATARPTLICVLPYLKDGVAGSACAWYLERFAREGFNVLLVDLRGCGSSEGIAREPWDGGDAHDCIASVEWAASQSWCNGRIGFWGASYGAAMGLLAASLRPPALRAVVAIEGAASVSTAFLNPGGIRGGFQPSGLWPAGDLAMQLLPPLHRDAQGQWSRIWKKRLEQARPRLFDYLRRPASDRHWSDTAIAIEAIEVPTLVVAGWRDFLCASSLDLFRRLRAPRKLIVGPWTHLMPDQSPIAPVDLTSITIRWWRRWLVDEPNGIDREPAVTAYVEGLQQWHAFETWPPAPANASFRAAGNGVLSQSASDFAPVAQPVDHAAGYRDHMWGFPLPGLPHDGSSDDRAGISFTSEPLDEATVIAGMPRIRVSIGARSKGISWVAARLSLVDAGGVSRPVTTGAATCDGAGAVDIALADTCFEVARGQRLRITLAAADFPRFWPQANAQVLELDTAPQLELPIIRIAPASRVSMPQHDPETVLAPLGIGLVPEWSVNEDLVMQAVTLTLGSTASMYTPQREATLELASRVSTTVSRLMPAASSVDGTVRAVARWQGQPDICVEGRLHVTATTAQAHATIHEGDTKLFEHSWKLDQIP